MAKDNKPEDIKRELKETQILVEDALRSIADQIGDIFEEATGQTSTLLETTVKDFEKNVKSTYRNLSKEMASVSEKAAKGMLKESDVQESIAKRTQLIARLEGEREMIKLQMGLALDEENEVTLELLNKIKNIKEQEEQINELLKKQLQFSKNINSAMGLTGNAVKSMADAAKKLGISGLDQIFDAASLAAQNMANQVTKGGTKAATLGGRFKVMGAALGSIGKGLVGLFKDPLFYVGLMVKALNGLKNMVFAFSQEAVDLGRNFGTAGDQAQRVTNELRTMASTSEFIRKDLIEGFIDLNQAAGTFGEVSRDNLETYVGLTKNAGYSKELAQDLYKLSILQGKSLKETAKSEFKRIKDFAKTNKLAINQKDVFEEIGKMSAATQLSIIGQGKSLGDAAVQAKKLGMDMQTLSTIADSLLDFESSIAAEMEAELLTGKQLNLERARAAALNNDMAALGKELAKQNITATSFGKQNRIQQEATAKALGMSRDALAESLLRQEAIRRGIVKEGQADLETQLKNLSVQEKFNRTLANIKEIFTDAIQPVITNLTNFFKDQKNLNTFKNTVREVAQGLVGVVKFLSDLIKGSMKLARYLGVTSKEYFPEFGTTSSQSTEGISNRAITISSQNAKQKDTSLLEATRENAKAIKELLAETKKNNERKMFVKMDSTKVGEAQSQTLTKVE